MKRLVFLDLETTGLSPQHDAIVQIGAIGVDCNQNGDWKTITEFGTLVYTAKVISPTASQITGITNNHLKDAPNIQCALKLFLDWLNVFRLVGEVYLIAYNGLKFDFAFLWQEMARCSIPLDSLAPAILIDPLVLLRSSRPQSQISVSYKLADIHNRLLGRTILQAHTAWADAVALYAICECQSLKYMLWTSGKHVINWLDYAEKLTNRPTSKKAKLSV